MSFCRDAPTSSSDGEEKKPVASSSASGHMPEMSADSKLMPLQHSECSVLKGSLDSDVVE